MSTIDLMLKIAKAKDIEDFYRKFPTEGAFFAKHGEALKKAQGGMPMPYLPPVTHSPGFVPTPTLRNPVAPTAPTLASPQANAPYMKNVKKFDVGKAANVGVDIVDAIQALVDERKALKKAKQWKKVSDVQLAAGQLTPDIPNRRYLRPEDDILTGEEFGYPGYGAGTNVLAKKGKKVPKAQFGMQYKNDFLTMDSDILSNLATNLSGGESAGSKFGGAAGDIVSMIPGVGPVLGKAAKPILQAVGNIIDTNPEKTRRYKRQTDMNIYKMAGMNGLLSPYKSFMEEGGELPSTRTGGKLRSNMEEDGELNVERGKIEPISYNPYLTEDGETVEFKGPSHKDGGMYTEYGNNPVEVEGGEPAFKMGDDNLMIAGDLDAKFAGYKGTYKTNVKKISDKENKQNKIINSSIEKLNNMDVATPHDKLKFASLQASIMGANMKLKKFAEEKTHLMNMQQATNDAAEEYGIEAKALSKNKVKIAKEEDKYAKGGGRIPKAQGGTPGKPANPISSTYVDERDAKLKQMLDKLYGYKWNVQPPSDVQKWFLDYLIGKIDKIENNPSPSQEDKQEKEKAIATLEKLMHTPDIPLSSLPSPLDRTTINYYENFPDKGTDTTPTESKDKTSPRGNKTTDQIADAIRRLTPYLRPSDVEELDPRQIMAELAAMADKEEPVAAQMYHSILGTPYDVSYQDQLNEITSQTNSAMRMAGNNPAAQAAIAAQAYKAKSDVLSNQFRANQEMKFRMSEANRNILNQEQMYNLQALDQQYVRQQQAKANTKATLREALQSIGEKYMKNQSENRTLATYENMYNYRFDPRFRAWNYNAPYYFNPMGTGENELNNLSGKRRVLYTRDDATQEYKPYDIVGAAKNGAIVKALKNL